MIEKILEQIDENTLTKESVNFLNAHGIKFVSASKMKEIVQEVAKEYGNGWIPVETAMPTEDGKYMVTVKNLTGFWTLDDNVFECDYAFGTFIFQGWEDNKVIAWKPKDAPYQKGE